MLTVQNCHMHDSPSGHELNSVRVRWPAMQTSISLKIAEQDSNIVFLTAATSLKIFADTNGIRRNGHVPDGGIKAVLLEIYICNDRFYLINKLIIYQIAAS